MKLLVATMFCLALTACLMVMPPMVPVPPVGDCGAAGLSAYLGGPVTDLPAHGPWGTLRVIRPGMMVTMDYSATRLNARVDGSGIILALTCG